MCYLLDKNHYRWPVSIKSSWSWAAGTVGYLVSNVAKLVDVLLCMRSDDASSKKSGVVLKTIECRSFLGNGLEYLSIH